MANLETWAMQAFGDYVVPKVRFDGLVGLLPIRKDPAKIIRWMLKTAIMVEAALPKGEIVKVPQELFPMASSAESLSDFFVWASYIVEPQFNLQILRSFMGIENNILAYRTHERSMNFGIQMNHLALLLFRCPDARPGFRGGLRVQEHFEAMPLWLNASFAYPRPTVPAFPTFEHFLQSLEVHF